jgi:hypothetical protein
MKARWLNLVLVAVIIAVCAFVSRTTTKVDEPMDSSVQDSSVRDLPSEDWWARRSQEFFPGSGPPLENIAFQRPESLENLDPSLYPDENSRCWAIEFLGSSGRSQAIDMVAPFIDKQPWKVRAAARLALGRLNAHQLALGGLQDAEVVTIFEDERRMGEGGEALRCKPVVLATLKGLTLGDHDAYSLPYLLAGLRSRPIERVTYDSTPEPFPDTVTLINPTWFQNRVADKVTYLGWSALPTLEEELKKPDFRLVETSGGHFGSADEHPDNQNALTIHRLFRELAPGLK